MSRCSNCGQTNPEGSIICANCAQPLIQACPGCGNWIPTSTLTCPECGETIEGIRSLENQGPDSKTAQHDRMLKNLRDSIPIVLARKIENLAAKMAGQRRDVTVLVVSIANFTAASQKLGNEAGGRLLDDLMHTLADVIYEYEGTIDKLLGDHLMVLFGLPVNHENDPERAVRAALGMLKVTDPLRAQLKQDYDLEIDFRIGINTGLVIAGNLGDQHHMEYTVIGDTVNLASQLENLTQPGTALVSFRTYQRTHPIFGYESLPPQVLKDYPAPLPVFRPLAVRATTGQARGLPGLQVPMVGREEDLRRLLETLAQVNEGKNSQVVLLSGEAGIGKTRLVGEFYHAVADHPVKVYFGSCASYLRISPYRVVSDLLRKIIHVSEMDSEEVQREALTYTLERLNLDRQNLLPYLVHVLGVSQADPFTEMRLKLLDPATLQRQIHAALRAFFVAAGSSPAGVFVFDDLHWIDPASRDFLVYFLQALENLPIMLVLIGRDFDVGPNTGPLVAAARKRVPDLLEIHLEALPVQGAHRLIDQLLHATSPTTNQVKERIIERAFGNPYYMEELVRILLDNGGLVRQETGWLITEAAVEMVPEVPGTLQDLILARFDLLPVQLKDTLQRAAVLRSAFGVDLLSRLSEEEGSLVVGHLKELENRGFLERAPIGGRDGYAFKHPLIQETIYNMLVKRDLRPLHLKVAQAIEAGDTSLPGEQSDILAYHYSESPTPLKAVPYLIASAEKASQRFANESAVQYYRQALDLMESSLEAFDRQVIQVQIGLGRALKFTGNFGEGLRMLENAQAGFQADGMQALRDPRERVGLFLESLREMADIRTREGKLEQAVQLLQQGLDLLSAIGPGQYLIPAKRLADRLAWVYFRQGKLKEAFSLAEEALVDAPSWAGKDPLTLASLYNTLGGAFWMRSSYRDAIECVKRGLEVHKSLNYAWGMAIAYTNLGVLQYSAGKWPEAIASLEEADAVRTQNGYLPERPTGLKNLGEVLVCTGEFEQARQKFETSLAISKRFGMNQAAAHAEIGLCRLAIYQAKAAEARTHLENASLLFGPMSGELDGRSLTLFLLQALLAAHEGRYAAGFETAQKAYSIAMEGGFTEEKNELLYILGILNTGLGQYGEAEQNFREAIQSAQSQGDAYLQAQGLLGVSQMQLARGQAELSNREMRLEEAKKALKSARALFTSLGAAYHLARAGSVLEQIQFLEAKPGPGQEGQDEE